MSQPLETLEHNKAAVRRFNHDVIHDQLAEGDRVTTRKTLHGTHRGPLLGVPATHRAVAIEVIDIVRLRDGRYLEHWGVNDLPSVVAALRQPVAP